MQLSSRILTALAVLILSVAVLTLRGVSPEGVEAATGTIDVLNVGTCYTTNNDVFSAGNCDDGDGTYNVGGRDSISEVGTVYATYSHDPKTAAESPRGILKNSDLIKISIQDTGRDKRTPVVLPVGGDETAKILTDAQLKVITDAVANVAVKDDTETTPAVTSRDSKLTAETVHKTATDMNRLATDMSWSDPGTLTTGVKNGLRVIVTGENPPDYLPMDVSDNAVIKFFGCSTSCGDGGTPNFVELSGLVLDEDRGSGRTDDASDGDTETAIAPWLNFQVHNATVDLQYIVYHTSERETLIGGQKMGSSVYGTGTDDPKAPNFTKSEKDNTSSLVVRVKSDGDDGSQTLRLYETGRFTGRYEGYARLTDADGDGSGDGATAANWGLDVGAATGHGDGSKVAESGTPAIIGVESGPLVVEYKDTDGKTQTLSISLDTVPPSVNIDTPAHKLQEQDTSPEFSGSFSDSESGLRSDSFTLYVDNSNDGNENGVDGDTKALNLAVVAGSVNTGNPYGVVADPGTDSDKNQLAIRSVDEYTGYGTIAQFGVLPAEDLYDLHTTTNDPNDLLQRVSADRFSDGDTDGTFADSVRIRITKSATSNDEVEEYNNTIDYQGLVADIAGNVGFSDSDPDGPRFINDYGDTGNDRKTGRYNVLGWYARHVFFLDEKPPEIFKDQSVTGFYGVNDDDKPVVNRSGILVAFDAAVDADTVSTNSFDVTLDPVDAQDTSPAMATVTDVTVVGRQVYLLLENELASNATPSVRIATGQSITDPAGNRYTRGDAAAFDVKDGIAPKLTVTLSGGSGTGTGGEASDMLTNKAMTISIGSDEEIQNTPSITVVCSNINWDDGAKDLGSFTSARSGPLTNASANFTSPTSYTCGDDATKVNPQQVQSFSRPGLEWEYQWQNFSGDRALKDGKLTVVAYGRDRQSYDGLDGKNAYSWGLVTTEFNFDITKPVLTSTPGDGDTVTDVRPFILMNYSDASTVSVSKLTVDGSEVTDAVQTLGARRFLYWPESLALGEHAIAVEATDAAGNASGSQKFSFKVAERATFDIKLIAGWNSVSMPANPIDPAVDAVFTESIVDMIAAWDGENPEAPWSIATRMDGEWSTHSDYATLNRITARYGYWVHSQGFATQSVALVGKGNREDPTTVPADLVEIPTNAGWNFVGVIDQDGDQTQDNFGEALKNGDAAISAKSYLGSNVRAYTWDAIRSRFDILEDGDSVTIGEGIWVYYGGGIAP